MTSTTLEAFIKQRPHLIWYSQNYQNLSKESVLEAVLTYGTWQDFLFLQKTLTPTILAQTYAMIKNKNRKNLSPRTINFYDHYFAKLTH